MTKSRLAPALAALALAANLLAAPPALPSLPAPPKRGQQRAAPAPEKPAADLIDRSGQSLALARVVEVSLARSMTWLRSQQAEDGSWQNIIGTADGVTALVMLALLAGGESPNSKVIERGADFLMKREVQSTYELGLKAAVLSQLPGPTRRAELTKIVRILIQQMIKVGESKGLYGYRQMPMEQLIGGDLSNSQYAVLGIWYASEAGVEVPGSWWRVVDQAWRGSQLEDGGFGYTPDDNRSYLSMTAAGAVTLFLSSDALRLEEVLHGAPAQPRPQVSPKPPGGKAGSSAKPASGDANAAAAIQWIATNFRADRNVGLDSRQSGRGSPIGPLASVTQGSYVPYMLYACERLAEASGSVRFGSRSWWDDGARFLVAMQGGDGAYQGTTLGPVVDTAYAVLFLARGRSPVVMSKLVMDGGIGGFTDKYPRDVASMIRWLRRQTERHVNWQAVELSLPAEVLRQTPVMYISGVGRVKMSEAELAALKRYIDEGGCVLAVAAGSLDSYPSVAFTRSIEDILARLYPRYPVRPVEKDHPMLAGNFAVQAPLVSKNQPMNIVPLGLKSVSNGSRELAVIVAGGDLPRKWESGGGFDPANRGELAIVGNLLGYLADRAEFRRRGEHSFVDRDPRCAEPATAWRVLRLMHPGNPDPEPLAWQALGNELWNRGVARVGLEYVRPADLAGVSGPCLIHLVTTHEPGLTPAEWALIRGAVDRGATLLVENAGGSTESADVAEKSVQSAWAVANLTTIPLAEPNSLGSGTLADIEYRPATVRRSGDRRGPAVLRGIQLPAAESHSARWSVIFSPMDLSSGMLGVNHDRINGYPTGAAREVMTVIAAEANR